ncbi:hypothetical protein LTR37_013215 [Vermiconidia calcicola]|uniref:Uncharacterized protein n=1 Tax=Vermiconidia calcicola TaxID=1690605 RepID=A0ACC3MZV3_9PEZI|nr:hypothetical protein LTR37_013215 [Vermiconidia calcicola]
MSGNQGNYAASEPLEKDFSNGYHLNEQHDPDDALRKINTAGSISISPELFEKIYLSPQNKVAGDLRKTVGNPTPFSSGAAGLGTYVAFGGILMLIGGIGEWILGNTFPCVVFGSFGSFWIAFSLTLMPYTGAYASFATDPAEPATGLETPDFNASWAFFLLFMGVLCLVYSICALRTNLVLFLILFLLVPAFCCLAAAYWNLALGKTLAAHHCTIAGGALTFVVSMLGWYIFAAILLAAVDFPLSLPVFDLSHIIKGASDKKSAEGEV